MNEADMEADGRESRPLTFYIVYIDNECSEQ